MGVPPPRYTIPSASAAAPPAPPVRSITRTRAPAAAAVERRRRPGRTEADDDHVGRLVPVGDLYIARCDVVRLAQLHPSQRCRRYGSCCRRPRSPTLGAVPTGPTVPSEPPFPRSVPPATDPPAPPPELDEIAPGWVPTLAYRLVPRLTTWRLSGPDGAVRFAKVARGRGCYPTLRGESKRSSLATPDRKRFQNNHDGLAGRITVAR